MRGGPAAGSTPGDISIAPEGVLPAKRGSLPLSAWALLLSNIPPLAGVFFWGWDAFQLLVLFWLENVVIGVIHVFRLALAGGGSPAERAGRFFLVPFFMVHYGLFTFVHGVFIVVLCGPVSPFRGDGAVLDPADLPSLVWSSFGSGGLALPLLVLAGSHLFSFVSNYILKGEYKKARPSVLMTRPYGRVVVLHLAILGGGFLAFFLGSPAWILVLLVLLKSGLDLKAHLKERLVLNPLLRAGREGR